jgi:MFS family permease
MDRSSSDRRFALLWFGQAVSQFGDYLPYVALPLFVRYLTNGTLEVALAYALDAIPAVLVGFFGGVLLDRLPLRNVMVVTDVLRAAAYGYLAWLAWTGPEPGSSVGLGAVLALAFVAGTLAAFFSGALMAAVPRLIHPDRLAVANSKLAGTENGAQIFGPAAAGLLIGVFGFWPTFALNAVTFLVSAATVFLVGPLDRRGDATERRSFWAEAAEGARFMWQDPVLRVATLGFAAANLAMGFIESTLVIAAERVGATAGWQLGSLFALMGVGALIGSILLPRVSARLGDGRVITLGVLGIGLFYSSFTAIRFGTVGAVLLALTFASLQMAAIAFVVLRQRRTPEHLMGRVATATRSIAWTPLPIGAVAGAALSEALDFGVVFRLAPFFVFCVGAVLLLTPVWRERTAVS